MEDYLAFDAQLEVIQVERVGRRGQGQEAESGQKWTIPVGGGLGKVFRIGKRPINASGQVFYNIERPDFAPDWTLRLQFTLLFPK